MHHGRRYVPVCYHVVLAVPHCFVVSNLLRVPHGAVAVIAEMRAVVAVESHGVDVTTILLPLFEVEALQRGGPSKVVLPGAPNLLELTIQLGIRALETICLLEDLDSIEVRDSYTESPLKIVLVENEDRTPGPIDSNDVGVED